MTNLAQYESPFSSRYSSQEMGSLFSAEYRFTTWRKLWIALAKAQKKLGLAIEEKAIQELEQTIGNFDWDRLRELEKRFKHDVMAHIEGFAELAPSARGILHLGATSCFVTDNADLIIMREAMNLLEAKLAAILRLLARFAKEHASIPTVAYTHFQPAQPTTVGKRACLWLQDFLIDLKEFRHKREMIHFLGAKGATGTQASFLALFDDNERKVAELDKLLAQEFGFKNSMTISGQTYTRKIDLLIADALSGFAASAHKLGTDLRLLAHLHEITEPFAADQVGSSAMPHKRNPIYAERICGLSRFIISLRENPAYTLATQWLERSLDDSSNRRLSIPESFLAADALCHLLHHILSGIHVDQAEIVRHLDEEKVFLSMEQILMTAVKRGGDRQALHAKLRECAQKMTRNSLSKDYINLIVNDPAFSLTKSEVEQILQGALNTGLSERQVQHFLKEEVHPLLDLYPEEYPFTSIET
jgi:adenylosuccinate lyase